MLLAAGHGTRLRPFTDSVPKCMVPIAGKPLLEHNIDWLRKNGINEVLINLHYRGEVIREYFGDGEEWGIEITYSVEPEILGTAGGVKNVSTWFENPFLLWYGDNLSRCDLRRLVRFHEEKSGLATIALYRREEVLNSGIVGLDESDRITRFLEKPSPTEVFSHWINAGIYVLQPEIFEQIPSGPADFGRDVFPRVLNQGAPLYGYRMSDDEGLWWIDTPEDLQRVREVFEATE